MLLSNYKRFAYAGIVLLIIFLSCEIALTKDDTGLQLNLGIGFHILIISLFLVQFMFFILPFYYVKSYNCKLFIYIIITGLLTIFIPALSTWYTITRLLKSKDIGFWANVDLFKTSAFRKTIHNIEDMIFILLFICQIAILMLSLKIKKLRQKEEV